MAECAHEEVRGVGVRGEEVHDEVGHGAEVHGAEVHGVEVHGEAVHGDHVVAKDRDDVVEEVRGDAVVAATLLVLFRLRITAISSNNWTNTPSRTSFIILYLARLQPFDKNYLIDGGLAS